MFEAVDHEAAEEELERHELQPVDHPPHRHVRPQALSGRQVVEGVLRLEGGRVGGEDHEGNRHRQEHRIDASMRPDPLHPGTELAHAFLEDVADHQNRRHRVGDHLAGAPEQQPVALAVARSLEHVTGPLGPSVEAERIERGREPARTGGGAEVEQRQADRRGEQHDHRFAVRLAAGRGGLILGRLVVPEVLDLRDVSGPERGRRDAHGRAA